MNEHITVEKQDKSYDLTPTQQAMLLYSLYAPESKAYFEQVCYSYRGLLDVGAFAEAWQKVVDRHKVLRTSFSSEDSERLRQTVHSEANVPFAHLDWRKLSACEQNECLVQFLKNDCAAGFDLSRAPLLRVAVLQTEDHSCWIVVSNHHIILDGWSMSHLRNEVSQIYQGLVGREQVDLAAAHHFGEYLEWLEKQNAAEAETFWRQELSDFSGPTYLPIDKQAGKLPSADESFAEKQTYLSASLTETIRSTAQRHHLTVAALLQGAWGVLLSRYCAVDDVIFGMTVSGRPYDLAGVESMVGLLINTLPVRVKLAAQDSCLENLKKHQTRVAGLFEHEHTSLQYIREWSELPPNLPLFDTLMVFENFAGSGSAFDLDGKIELVSSHLSRTNYPLTLVVEPGVQLRLQLVYQCSRFDDDAIERMLAHLAIIIASMAEDMNQPIAALPLLTEAERHTLIVELNETRKEISNEKCINRLFEQQVELTPYATAVIHERAQLTYSELNARANQLAHYLKSLGVGPERRVGICLERSIEMVVAVLATLKAGGAYLPLDPTYPRSRLDFMLQDGGVEVLLTNDRLLENLPGYGGRIVRLGDQGSEAADNETELINAQSKDNLSEAPAAANLAYVIYTSGSTGTPKGTMIEHDSLVNFTRAAAEAYEISPADRVLQFASLSFDTSAEEIFPALCQGACLVLRTDSMISSAVDFFGGCTEFGVTVLDLPTAYWHELTDELATDKLSLPSSMRLVILGGEKALPERLRSWRELGGASAVRLVNSYGPTEATIVATMSDLSASGTRILRASHTAETPVSAVLAEVPIGGPISNATVYVLDPLLRPVPVGIPGELHLGGMGVARGYLNRADLTAEKFIPNPFSSQVGQRLYKTGDVVRYRSDGELQYLGRIDHQVKVRGFRIELEEVEQAIRSHENVSDAVVIATEDANSNNRLVAYVVAARDTELTGSEVREFLTRQLPAYMVPSAFAMLDSLPLMPNGKLDRQALPRVAAQRTDSETAFQPPRTFLEEALAKSWCGLLQLDRVSVHDNFFELGGHSLLGAKLISTLRRDMNVCLKLIDVFQSPTIASLAELIYQRQTEDEAEADLISLLAELQNLSDEEAELTLAQELTQHPPATQISQI